MEPRFSRRGFFGLSFGAAVAASASKRQVFAGSTKPSKEFPLTTFSSDHTSVRFYTKAVAEPTKILQISDVHLFIDDERGNEFRQYSERMSKAYNHTRHFESGADTNPQDALKDIAERAKGKGYDALALTGDIVSFPSAAGVDYVKNTLASVDAPFYYVCGNHDWHFEGMEGTERDLRDEWIEKRLKSLYPKGVNPLAYAVKIKGVKLLFIDDSIYEILPEQLEFLKKELADNMPSLLFMHIPLYAPGRRVAFGGGHPDWNAANDGNYKIERRLRWPEEGHNETTYAFYNEVLNASNLIGVFTGHIHQTSLDILNGKPSSVVRAANDGSTLKIEILPYPNKG